jgi:hypothetical protein
MSKLDVSAAAQLQPLEIFEIDAELTRLSGPNHTYMVPYTTPPLHPNLGGRGTCAEVGALLEASITRVPERVSDEVSDTRTETCVLRSVQNG